jgi:hypothetical protein
MPRKPTIASRKPAKKLADLIEVRTRQQKTDKSKIRAIEAADRLNREMEDFLKHVVRKG